MLKVVCVLKSGGDFTGEYVKRLYEGVSNNLNVDHLFLCLTDVPDEVDFCCTRDLVNDLPGWWSKMEVFKLKGPVLYFDLDTVIVGNLDKFLWLKFGHLYMLRDFYRGINFASGVMYWDGDFSWIYYAFKEKFETAEILSKRGPGVRSSASLKINGKTYLGDQDFLQEILPLGTTKFIQEEISGIYSYKVHCKESVPLDANIICFHGRPRPHEVTEGPLKW